MNAGYWFKTLTVLAGLAMSLPGCTNFAKLAVQGAGIEIDPPDARLQTGPPRPELDARDHPKVTAFQLAASEAVCHDYYGDLLQHSLKTSDLFNTKQAVPVD